MRSITMLALLLAGASAVLPGCCASQAARTTASSLVDEVEASTLRREDDYQTALRSVAEQYFTALRDRLKAETAARRATLSLEVWRKADAKRLELDNRFAAELEQALGPSLARMSREIEEEQKKPERSSASQDREIFLRGQLAATLAYAQREHAKLVDELQKKIADRRDEILRTVESQLADSIVSLDPAAEATKAIADWKSGLGDEYARNLRAAAREINRFIQTDSALSLVLKGLSGGAGSGSLIALLTGKAEDLTDSLAGTISTKATEITDSLKQKLESVEKET